MEGFKVLKDMMDTLFSQMDLYSWSIHKNKSGITVCSLRFKDIQDSGDMQNSNSVAFKRKSKSQQLRDKQRLENFNRPYTRSQAIPVVEDTETFRDCGGSDSLSETGPVTPECVLPGSDVNNTPLHLVADSPGINHIHSSESCDTVLEHETENMPDMNLSLAHSSDYSLGDASLPPNPDPPPDDDEHVDDIVDYGNDIVNEVMNKPGEVSIRDALRVMQTFKSFH